MSGAIPPVSQYVFIAWLGVKLTTHLQLVPRLRMHRAIPPLLQYAFMAWYLVKHRDFTFTSNR
jgi:hypothetical protein